MERIQEARNKANDKQSISKLVEEIPFQKLQ